MWMCQRFSSPAFAPSVALPTTPELYRCQFITSSSRILLLSIVNDWYNHHNTGKWDTTHKNDKAPGQSPGVPLHHSIEIHGYKVTKMKDRGANFNLFKEHFLNSCSTADTSAALCHCCWSCQFTNLHPILRSSTTHPPPCSPLPIYTLPPTQGVVWGVQQTFLHQSRTPCSYTQRFYSNTVDLNIPVNLLVDKAVATQITPSNQLLYLSYFAVPNVCIYYGIHEREISDLLPVSPSFRRWCRTKRAAF